MSGSNGEKIVKTGVHLRKSIAKIKQGYRFFGTPCTFIEYARRQQYIK